MLPSEQSHLRVLGYEGCLAAVMPFRKRDTDIGTVMIGQSQHMPPLQVMAKGSTPLHHSLPYLRHRNLLMGLFPPMSDSLKVSAFVVLPDLNMFDLGVSDGD